LFFLFFSPSESVINQIVVRCSQCQKLAEIDFRFREKKRAAAYTSAIVGSIHTFPGQYLLTASSLFFQYDASLIAQYLALLNPHNFRVFVISQTLAQKNEAALVKEPWYGTQYRSEDLSADFLKNLEAPAHNPALFLHQVNEFVPENLELLPSDTRDVSSFILPCVHFDLLTEVSWFCFSALQKGEYPVLIRDTELSRVWFKKDSIFLVPKANIEIIIRTSAFLLLSISFPFPLPHPFFK